VPIFKRGLLLLSILASISAQDIVKESIDSTLISLNKSSEIEILLDSILIEGGDLGDYYSLSKIIGENDTKLEYELFSQNAFIDSLIFIDDVSVTKRIQKLIFKTMVGTTPTVETQSTFNSIFTTNNYVSAKSVYQIVRYENEKVGAVIRWEPVSESYFSGIIGANRSDDDSWVFNGQLDLHFENSWNTLNRIDVNWRRLDEDSQLLKLDFEEPYIFGLPVGSRFTYEQDLRQGLYVRTDLSGSIILHKEKFGDWYFGSRNTQINVTASGVALGIEKLKSNSLFLGSILNRTNDRWIPTSGFKYNMQIEIGQQKTNDENQFNVTGKIRTAWVSRMISTVYLKSDLLAEGIWVRDGFVHPGQKMRFGGINTLRGYNEDFFQSNWIIIPNLELQLIPNISSNYFIFLNSAIQDQYNPKPYGYGFGITQLNKNTVIKIIYGIGRDDSFSNGKIHLSLITRI